MAKTNKVAIVLNQNEWAIRLAERRASEIGARPPVEESTHKGFIVKVPNPSDILAWCLDEIGRQEGELAGEAQCWQDQNNKKKMLNWNENCKQIIENLGDLLTITAQLTHVGVKVPNPLPWNENGLPALDMEAITQEALQEVVEESQETAETPEPEV
tara:strand:+ start:334 stop:804 length:471 start_codon:yes stop_codon:yes gene_type:complete